MQGLVHCPACDNRAVRLSVCSYIHTPPLLGV